jgi:hypothetical protein
MSFLSSVPATDYRLPSGEGLKLRNRTGAAPIKSFSLSSFGLRLICMNMDSVRELLPLNRSYEGLPARGRFNSKGGIVKPNQRSPAPKFI